MSHLTQETYVDQMPGLAVDSHNWKSDELTIHTQTSVHQKSPMRDDQKQKVRQNSPALMDLFNQTLRDKGEYPLPSINFISDDEIQVEGISQMTLHNFILKAEALGKKVTYTKTLSIRLSDDQ